LLNTLRFGTTKPGVKNSLKNHAHQKFTIKTTHSLKISFRYVTPCRWVEREQRFGEPAASTVHSFMT